jgi:cytoskeletal protein CcmA (bactofilin family)
MVMALLALLLALWASPVSALERRARDNASVPAGETIDDDLAIAGDVVTIGGRVAGDVYAAGETITILPGAQIDGDLIAAGASLLVNGTVGGSVRAAGATLQLDGTVGRNVTVAGSRVTLGPNAVVKGNWMSGSENLALQGGLDGNLLAAGTAIQLAGQVGRNAELGVRSLVVQPIARIGGNLTYMAPAQVELPPGVVQGQVQFVPAPERQREERPGPNVVGIVFGLILLAGSIIVGLLIAWLAPTFFPAAQAILERRPLLAFGVGLVTLIVTPVLAVILMITILGLPLGVLGLVAYFVGWYIGWLAAATALAGLVVGLVRRQGRPVAVAWLVALGLIGLDVITRIPFAGGLIGFIVLCLGLGILVILVAERLRPPAGVAPAR